MDESGFEPRLGRMRSTGSRRGRNYLHAVLAAAGRAGFPKPHPGRPFLGIRKGRGGVAARILKISQSGVRARRAIIKMRVVRLGGRGLAAARAHLRYIQRDGVSREGEAGGLYSSVEEEADGKAFLERSSGDRHQFRLILSAEDGTEYEDLRPLVRRFMCRMEQDLGTGLEWIAVDHVDTLHPHTHVMLRGKDDAGANLVIAPEYIKRGMRERLAGLVSIDLGPRSDLEIAQRLRLEVGQERLTSIDRRLIRDMDPERIVMPAGRDLFDHSIRTGRLRKLASLGLAEPIGGGRWRLGEGLEAVLGSLGERGDIIRTMQRELKSAGVERAPAEQALFRPEDGASVTGRIVGRGLSDELGDRHYLVVDGIDGRSHYVEIGKGSTIEPFPPGSIVRVNPRSRIGRLADERIAAVAALNAGRYSAELHLEAEPEASPAFAHAHVRRLEAIRRALGSLERFADGSWSVPAGFLDLAGKYEARLSRDRPVEIEMLSPVPLERLMRHDGATWLDRELISSAEAPRDQGFGREVRSARAARQAWLVEKGLARLDGGRLECRAGMLEALKRRELDQVSAAIAAETGLGFAPAEAGSQVEGIVRRRVDLPSGQFGMIDDGREFSLVPWHPVLERALGSRVSGTVNGSGGISWRISRAREIEI